MSPKKSNRTIEYNLIKKSSFFKKTINFDKDKLLTKRAFLIILEEENLEFRKLMDQYIKDEQIENLEKIM